jgi:hypothetical protein
MEFGFEPDDPAAGALVVKIRIKKLHKPHAQTPKDSSVGFGGARLQVQLPVDHFGDQVFGASRTSW